MSNRNDPAAPCEEYDDAGLTKKEYAAIHILSGFFSSNYDNFDKAVSDSVQMADMLFNELEEE